MITNPHKAFEIREGSISDLPQILELIRELARYEKMEHEVENNIQMMESDGFGVRPVFGSFVAIFQGKIIGAAIYYFRYSTWKGKRLYLEDLIVHEPMRGKGIGKKLFERVMQKVIDDGFTGMMWQVLDWNAPAIEFYKTFSTRFDPEWINCHLESEQIKLYLEKHL
jgi:GNAT superfamily N-acetyltransferase